MFLSDLWPGGNWLMAQLLLSEIHHHASAKATLSSVPPASEWAQQGCSSRVLPGDSGVFREATIASRLNSRAKLPPGTMLYTVWWGPPNSLPSLSPSPGLSPASLTAPRASPGSLPIRLTTFPLINFWYVYSCLVSVSWRTQTDSCLLRTAFQHHPGNFLHLFFGRFLVSWIRGLHLSWFTFFFGGMHTPHGQENWWNLVWLKTLISPSRDKLAGYGILVWKVIFHRNFKYILHCRIVYSATFYIWFFVCDLFFSDRCIFKHIISSILYSLELISLNFINL